MNKFLITLLVIILAGFGIYTVTGDSKLGYSSIDHNVFSGGVTSASTSVGVGATSILSRDTGRLYAMICNDGAGIVSLHFTATDTSVSTATGIPIASSTAYNSCYEIDTDNLYVGQIYGIADTTTTIKVLYK